MEPAVYTGIIGIAVSLVGSAFFSGSETVLTSLSQPQVQRLIEEEGVEALKLWRDRPIQVLTTILIGNNIFNITASALATDLAQTLLGDRPAAIPVAVGGMTFLLLTFGEITPKSFATQFARRAAPWIMRILRVVYIVIKPLSWAFTKMTRHFMGLFGGQDDEHYATPEEIEYLVDVGIREGSISEDRERMLRSVFEFPDTIVREVMVPRTEMVTVSVDMDLETIVDILVDCGHSRIPVRGENLDDIRGLFYAKDLIRLAKSDQVDGFELENYLREPYFVPEQKGIAELLSEFQAERMHMALVVDEFGGTAGLITLEDIIEEFFGEIQDEYDTEEPPQIERIDEQTARVDARVPIDEVESFCEMELPDHPDYDSLGGFLMAQSGSVPEPGTEIPWEHVVFRVLEADPKSVQTVEIHKSPVEETGAETSEVEAGGLASSSSSVYEDAHPKTGRAASDGESDPDGEAGDDDPRQKDQSDDEDSGSHSSVREAVP